MSLLAWSAALDEFEAALRAQEAVLCGQPDRPDTFRPPEGIGPLPIELLPRALELARACAELTGQLHVARERAQERLGGMSPPGTPPGPAFLSTHA